MIAFIHLIWTEWRLEASANESDMASLHFEWKRTTNINSSDATQRPNLLVSPMTTWHFAFNLTTFCFLFNDFVRLTAHLISTRRRADMRDRGRSRKMLVKLNRFFFYLLQCDGISLDLANGPHLQGVALLNIPYTHGGSNLWGEHLSQKRMKRSESGPFRKGRRLKSSDKEYSANSFNSVDLSIAIQGTRLIESITICPGLHSASFVANLTMRWSSATSAKVEIVRKVNIGKHRNKR